MKSLMIVPVIGLSLVGLSMAGCGSDNSMTKEEIAATGHAPPMTDAQKAAMASAMANGAKAAQASGQNWAKANPTKLAEVNAERAKAGKPPLSP